jgi:BclB C-terminal domain-containing protein
VASGLPVAMTLLLTNAISTPGYLGFGNSATGAFVNPLSTTSISLSGGTGVLLNMAFSMPYNGIITGISAYFSLVAALNLLSTLTVNVAIYQSTTPNNTFTIIPSTNTALSPNLTGVLNLGTIAKGNTTGLNIPVAIDTRLVVVVYVQVASGINIANVVTGYVSAGVSISQ